MRRMPSVLAFATLMASIWTGTVAQDSEAAIQKFLAKNFSGAKSIVAKLINVDKAAGSLYKKADQSNENVVDLVMQAKPYIPLQDNPHKICGYDLGIQINMGWSLFCIPRTISLEVYKDEGGEQMRLIVQFRSALSAELLKLYVPLFEVPPQYLEKSNLWKWTNENGLELLGPFLAEDLIYVAEEHIIPIYFGWLDRLVSFGVYRAERSASNEFSAWTRPLVLRPEMIKEFVKVWNQFKGTKNA